MEFPWSKYPSFRSPQERKRLLIAGSVVAAVAVVAVAGLVVLRSGYLQRRSLRASQEFFAAGDVRSALLMLQQTVQIYPDNLNARRMLAEYYLSVGSPAAVDAWRELAEMEPGNDLNLLNLAEAAVGFGNEDAVREALAALSPEGKRGAPYYRILAGLALKRNDAAALRAAMAELERLEPGLTRHQYNRAALDVRSSDPAVAAAARGRLEEMARGQSERIRATLQLLQLAREGRRGITVAELARVILGTAPPTETGQLAALAEHMKSQPAPTPEDAAELIRWMAAQGRATEALGWISGLSPEMVTARPVALARAAAAIHAKDWRALQLALRAGAWGPIRPELIESAFAAQERRPANESAALHDWDIAVDQATGSLGSLRFLDNLSIALSWPVARERVLWRMGRDFPKETGAWRVLALGAEAKGDSQALAKVYQGWLAAEPGNPAVEASQAVLAVIRGEVPDESREWLRRSAAQPGSPIEIAAAWAWLETQAGRGTQALAGLDAIQHRISERPRACLFYGLILAQAGRRAEARIYLTRAEGQPKLLPEEKVLLAKARMLAGSGL